MNFEEMDAICFSKVLLSYDWSTVSEYVNDKTSTSHTCINICIYTLVAIRLTRSAPWMKHIFPQ